VGIGFGVSGLPASTSRGETTPLVEPPPLAGPAIRLTVAREIDWDAAASGYRRPGLFFAIWGTATKLAFALAIGIAFPLLDAIGFDPNGGNTAAQITGLALLYGAAPIAFKLAALTVMRGYAITREAHEEIRRNLAARPC